MNPTEIVEREPQTDRSFQVVQLFRMGIRKPRKKLYGDYGQFGNEKYSPGRITEVISKIRDGRPDPEHISTSYVERSNLSLRMHLRRFTRLTNAYSKKLDNLKAAVCLWFAYYNFCRVHQSLRITPAVQAGLTDHVWNITELIQ